MSFSRTLWLLLVPSLLGCSSDEEPMSTAGDDTSTSDAASSENSGSTAADTSTTNGASTTMDPGTGTDTSGGNEGTTADTGTGEVCAAGLEPAAFDEIAGCEAPVGTPLCSEGQDHVPQDTDIDWDHDPPHSGPHYPTWEAWTEHAEPVPRGNWVHNLEHGGIVLLYRCDDGCAPELDVLREVMAARPELRILLTADSELPEERFAALSWTWVYRFDIPEPDALLCFADQHEGHAPEDVP